MPILRKKILYQFGNGDGDYFVFPRENLSVIPSTGVKTIYSDNPQIDGNSKTTDKFRKTAKTYKIDFLIKDNQYYDMDYLQKVFWSGREQIAYFYDLDTQNNIQFYYTYLTVTKGLDDKYESSASPSQEAEGFSVELTASNPFYYKCIDDTYYLNKDLAGTSTIYGNVAQYGTTARYGGSLSDSQVNINTLSINQKREYFDVYGDVNSINNRKYPIYYVDRFLRFDPTINGVSLNASNLLINTTLTTNDPTDVYTADLLKDSTSTNQFYWIEIGQLQQNEWIKIVNQKNNSGLFITWLNATSSTTFYYNSKTGRCYDNNGAIIPFSKLQILREATTDTILNFEPDKSINKHLFTTTQQIRLTKNTSTNLTLKIEALQSYH